MKILAVDDNETNLKVVTSYLKGLGHKVISATSGEDSIKYFSDERPDMVLMDIMMPGMDGYEATRKIKELSGSDWTPVIFMSALAQDDDKIKGLDAGGDDYLTKPVELSVLGAKINAMQRIADMQQTLKQTRDELQAYKEAAEEEHRTAQNLMSRIVGTGHIEDKRVKTWTVAADHFSGDLIASSLNDAGRIYMIVADSTGHGLTAALPLVPVSQTFFAMTKKGYSTSVIVTAMNSQLKRMMPTTRFVATSLVAIDTHNCSIEVWNGGNPVIYFCDEQGEVLRKFEPACPALGIIDEDAFNSKTDMLVPEQPGSLVICSDGLLDAENESGELFGEARLLETLKQPGDHYENIKKRVRDFIGKQSVRDDISLVVASCSR
ncbi:MAG: fused response regulator/phosphatase [Thioalkalispiraceae bacterium]|jgi:CheY-like chemotaxis protein